MFAEAVELVIEEMLQSLTLRIALLGVLLKPCVVLKRASRILLAPGDNLRKQFLRLHHFNGCNTIEESKHTLIDGCLTSLLIVT